jgi:hypothetical protein
VLAPLAAAAVLAWSQPITLSAPLTGCIPARCPRDVAVLMNPAGDALVSWNDRDGVGAARCVFALRARGESRWSNPIQAPGSQACVETAIALEADGSVTVAWSDARDGGLFVQTRGAGGSWLRGRRVAAPGVAVREPALVVSARHALLVWQTDIGVVRVTRAAVRGTDGRFGDAATLYSGEGPRGSVALDANGDAAVGWITWGSGHDVIQIAFKPVGGRWELPHGVAERVGLPLLALSPGGSMLVVWNRAPDPPRAAIRRRGDRRFGAVQLLPLLLVWSRISAGADGTATVVGVRFRETHNTFDTVYSKFVPRRGWSRAIVLANATYGLPTAAFAATGRAVVIWLRGADPAGRVIQASLRGRRGGFGRPLDIPGVVPIARSLAAGIDDAGDVVVAWDADGVVTVATR